MDKLLVFSLGMAVVRALPVALFLVQYRGKLGTVSVLLRGFAAVILLQAANTILFLFVQPDIFQMDFNPFVLWSSTVANLANTVLAWYLYLLFRGVL